MELPAAVRGVSHFAQEVGSELVMPKRVVDGEALWKSKKLSKVQPPTFRAEYANLIPLALANGVFECDPALVWATVYAYNRPDIKQGDVLEILAEFERVGMLFRWFDSTGKQWGYWVAIDRSGRLPPKSRIEHSHEKLGLEVPLDALHQFMEAIGQPVASQGTANGSEGFGFGLGFGLGSGCVDSNTPISLVSANLTSTTAVVSANAPTRPTRASRLPEKFQVTDAHRAWATEHEMPSPDSEIDAFIDYWRAKSGRGATKLDWDATFRSWLRITKERSRGGKGNGKPRLISSLTDEEFERAMAEADRYVADRDRPRH